MIVDFLSRIITILSFTQLQLRQTHSFIKILIFDGQSKIDWVS